MPPRPPGGARILLLVYSLGLAVPFVLVGIGFDRVMSASRWLRDRYDAVRFVSGAILVAIGLLLFFGRVWWIRIAFNASSRSSAGASETYAVPCAGVRPKSPSNSPLLVDSRLSRLSTPRIWPQ